MNLPELPESDYGLAFWDEGGMQEARGVGYTEEHMHAYAQAAVKAALAEQAARIQELEKDAKRLDWAAQNPEKLIDVVCGDGMPIYMLNGQCLCNLRLAIDAAIASSEGQGAA